ncbi:MAG TPA: hypothetical protein VG738_09030 [Chitinophagaceae bacterium]|nr:hypothetical protein [Chitinophagaceae bacterium]
MKKAILLLIIFFIYITATAQGFMGFGAGTNSFKSVVVNLYGGCQVKHIVAELEMKAPPIDMRVADPATFSFKTGYEITLAGNFTFLPQVGATYLKYSSDESKGITTWQNGWKPAMGARLRWGHIFAQADYTGTTNLCFGICAQFKSRQTW